MKMNCLKKGICFLSIMGLSAVLLSACGGVSTQSPADNTSGAAVEAKNQALSVPEQMDVILAHKDMWLNEEVRMEGEGEEAYAEGPMYSLMDLDQDGYIELIVYDETGQSCPAFYEVTENGMLQKWTTTGDLPQAEMIGIFDMTRKVDCYYDESRGQYHYIVFDYLAISQDDANVLYLEMTPGDNNVDFRQIGKYTFDAQKDEEHHYFNARGQECQETDITAKYEISSMKKKTMYYNTRSVSKKEGEKLTEQSLIDTLWSGFLLRDDYRCDKEQQLTE